MCRGGIQFCPMYALVIWLNIYGVKRTRINRNCQVSSIRPLIHYSVSHDDNSIDCGIFFIGSTKREIVLDKSNFAKDENFNVVILWHIGSSFECS